MQPLLPIMAVQGLVIAAIALGAAWLARRLHLRGWCGALIVGLVIGAALHSRCPLNAADPIFNGGQTEQHAIDRLAADQQAEHQALIDTGVTPEAVTELDAQHIAALQPLIDAHTATVDRHHDATRLLALLGTSLLLLIAGAVKPGRLGDALPLALGAAAVIGGGAYAAGWLLGLPLWPALACGCGAAAVPIGHRSLAAADEYGASLVTSVAWWLLTFALAVATGLDPKFGPAFPVMGLFLALALLARLLDKLLTHSAWRLLAALALGAAWFNLIPSPLLPGAGAALLPGGAWLIGQVLVHGNIDLRDLRRWVGPIVALLVGMSVNIVTGFNPWLLLAALIVMCDARAIGVWVVSRLLGGRGRDSLQYACILAIPGPATLIVAWLLHDGQIINAPVFGSLVIAALIGGVLGEPIMRLLHASSERPTPGS